jgi:hypothetical protein
MNQTAKNNAAMVIALLACCVGVGGASYYASLQPATKTVDHYELAPHHKHLILEGRDDENSAVLDENRDRVEDNQ